MQKKLPVSTDEAVCSGLHARVGRRHIGRFLADLARPHVVPDALLEGYRAMAADEEAEAEALEWCEGLIGDVADEQ